MLSFYMRANTQQKPKVSFLFTQILLASLFFIVGNLLAWLIAVFITRGMYGSSVMGAPQAFVLKHPWPGLALGLGVQALVGYSSFRFLVGKREQRAPRELQGPHAFEEFLAGAALGVIYITVVMGVLALFGGYQVTGVAITTGLVVGLMLGVGAAFAEEVLFRGFMLRLLDKAYGTPTALTVVALLFGLIHLLNGVTTGEVSWWGAVAIVLEAGFLLNAAYCLTRRLWFVIGLHLAWNFMLSGVFGLPVSGIDAGGGFLQGTVSGPVWLTGGTFGPEGSVIAVVFGLGLGVFLLAKAQQRGNLTTRIKRTP